jgi:Tol biopolymer transport system component
MKRVLAALTATLTAVIAIACSGGSDDVVPAALADERATLAYVTVSGTEATLWMREPDGESHAVATYPEEELIFSLLGSPDGRYIAANAGHMVILDRDGERLLTLEIALMSFSGAGPFASWTPDAARFAYALLGTSGIQVIDVTTGEDVTPSGVTEAAHGAPSFAPDGERLAAMAEDAQDANAQASLAVFDADGSHDLLTPRAEGMLPLWSPSGEWLAYWSQAPPRGMTAAVFAVSPSGGTPRLLAEAHFPSPQAWTRDGKRIALSCVGDGPNTADVCVVDMSDGEVTRLTDDGGSFLPAFSPDGRQIAYITGRETETGLYTLRIVDVETNETTEVATDVIIGGFTWLANAAEE